MTDRSDIVRLVDGLVADGRATAAVALVQRGSDTPPVGAAAGFMDPLSRRERVDPSTRFDLASITKAFSGTLALVLDQDADLRLDTRLGEIWPTADDRLIETTLDDLLRHRAGFRRWMPLYALCDSRQEVAERLLSGEWVVESAPVYSDLDFVLWSLSVERALERRWTDLLQDRVLDRLGEQWSGSPPGSGRTVAGCLLTTGREVELAAEAGVEVEELPPPERGQPQDGNCRFLGRPSGHAGLFGSAAGVLALGRLFCGGEALSASAVTAALGGSERYALGWFRGGETAGGRALGDRAFGHEGFTGGSLWVDPDADLVVVLLAHRSSLAVDLSVARAELHRLALDL